jgi:hypothetical protein
MMTDETQTPTDQAETDPKPQDQAAQAPDSPETDAPATETQPEQPQQPEAPAAPEPEAPVPATPDPEVPQPSTPQPEMPQPADQPVTEPQGSRGGDVEGMPTEEPSAPQTAAVERYARRSSSETCAVNVTRSSSST